jgi:hypothetical protein
MIRVFPRRTAWTPTDELAFVGDPPFPFLKSLKSFDIPVRISCAFSWDIPAAERLKKAWSMWFSDVQLGAPAYGSPAGDFTPGLFVKPGITFTSRGCPNHCPFCLVPEREGPLRELEIKDGHNVADNNLLACSPAHIDRVFAMLRRQPKPAIFSGGLDARRFNQWHVDLLKSIRLDSMFFACDSPADLKHLGKVAKLIPSPEWSREKKRCYVLVGFNGESPREAEARLKAVYNLDFLPFAMLYRGPDSAARNTPEFHDLVGVWRSPRVYKMIMEGPRRPRKGGVQLRMQGETTL